MDINELAEGLRGLLKAKEERDVLKTKLTEMSEVLRISISMVKDMKAGYPVEELCWGVEELESAAQKLGVTP